MEPTRQQIKEAFKKTLERWEKIVEDVDYYNNSECALCLLESPNGELYVCSQSCPIRLNTNEGRCYGTPYGTFFKDKTPINAFAELNFLRKVYIWWVEGEGKDKQEEKKEEWVDISARVFWKPYISHENESGFFLQGYYEDKEIAFFDADGMFIKDFPGSENYKKEEFGNWYSILKKI